MFFINKKKSYKYYVAFLNINKSKELHPIRIDIPINLIKALN